MAPRHTMIRPLVDQVGRLRATQLPRTVARVLIAFASALTLVITLTLESCTVTRISNSPSSATATPAAAEINRTGRVEWSLAPPLTRAVTGMADGQSEVIYSPLDRLLNVRLHLPGGTVVETDANYVAATARSTTAEPNHLEVAQGGLRADDAQQRLTTYVDLLGLDATKIAAWRPQSDVVADGGDGSAFMVFTGRMFDTTSVEVQAYTTRGEHRVQVTVMFNWPV